MTLVFLLEEPSAKALIERLLPKLLARTGRNADARFVVFDGKQDLEKNLVRKLRGWQSPDARFIVLRDQDGADCGLVKTRLCELVEASGRKALVRVACRELESWVLGDIEALATEYDAPSLKALAGKAKFRDPDQLGNPVQELRRMVPDYQKIDGARRMGPRLDPESNRSASFRAFCRGLVRVLLQENA